VQYNDRKAEPFFRNIIQSFITFGAINFSGNSNWNSNAENKREKFRDGKMFIKIKITTVV